MINRLSYIVVTATVLIVAISQVRAQTSGACSGIDCQHGTCVPLSNNSYPSNILSPYQCTCNPGWQTLEGLLADLPHVLTLPCTIPNCTLNLGCGGTPAPPVQAPLTLDHISSPCSLPGICGHGDCVVTDLTKYPPMYKCNCQPGFANVGNLSAGYCLKDCEVGSNCRAIGVTLPSKSAGSLEASVVGSFKIAVAVVSALWFSPLLL
ncbi:hypothetical protein M758_4G016800 [Ceratodon purpureus]|uniref:EGF-like domain-containing protein n=1 Tax=Ceratodon purpureus TaxID=3225 RepID=A0A8T0I7I2_CERPU|nr:hypothetical protein KC19_4G018900 [Ceratodon purpureus]KAG0578382.1 hypothetical protein KC19_4G018900 [Ceratodon purpureus]KAG0578383.1 hypothetical protein KC19_4G018900 [Ceratodon purpureus]KAG0578384.1 hypothetical protein KC19_4G018900 [Ceratodon purpureus]KAG0617811.1 hypothetical protein M758_4G016800 [Ceratodon purpureus]